MKNILKIFLLFALLISGCNSKKQMTSENDSNLELEVIYAVLPSLLLEHPPCMVIPKESESPEKYDERLQEFYHEIDSVGKKVEIVSSLIKLDSNLIQYVLQPDTSEKVQLLLRAPRTDKKINEAFVEKINDVKIIFIIDPRSVPGGLTDCYTLGQFTFSRVGFNSDSTRAAFRYFMDDGICTGGSSGIVEVERKGRNWKMVN